MIGGSDKVFSALGDPKTLDACVRIVREYWPHAKFENALTGEKYDRYAALPFGLLRELFVYPDAMAEGAWDRGEADAAANSMLYLILSPHHVTVIMDDPTTQPMKSIIDSIEGILTKKDVWNTYTEAA